MRDRYRHRYLSFSWKVMLAAVVLVAVAEPASAQSMMRHLDFSSPDMTGADFAREEVAAKLAAASPDEPADFTRKRLNGLDLSGLDFSGAILRSARLNKTDLSGATLRGAVLDQAWMTEAKLTGADLRDASLFQAQLRGAVLDNADLSGVRMPANLTKASLKGAKLIGADLSADMRNQSMGLIGGVLKSADLEGADLSQADLSRVDLEFASLVDANLTKANLSRAKLGGADLTGATIEGANFLETDVDSARLLRLRGADSANLDKAKNLAKAFR